MSLTRHAAIRSTGLVSIETGVADLALWLGSAPAARALGAENLGATGHAHRAAATSPSPAPLVASTLTSQDTVANAQALTRTPPQPLGAT